MVGWSVGVIGDPGGMVLFVFELEPVFFHFLVAVDAFFGQQVTQVNDPQECPGAKSGRAKRHPLVPDNGLEAGFARVKDKVREDPVCQGGDKNQHTDDKDIETAHDVRETLQTGRCLIVLMRLIHRIGIVFVK